MTENGSQDLTKRKAKATGSSQERLVYVMPQEAIQAIANNEITLLEFWLVLWRRKWFIVGLTTLFAVASVIYALIATEYYRSDVLLAPAEPRSTPNIANALGGLANLAGVSVGSRNSVEPLAVLQSRKFIGDFIQGENLMPVFFPEEFVLDDRHDNESEDGDNPDLRDAVRYFKNNVFSVSEDRDTGLVTMAIEWTDPRVAADWATSIVRRLNDRMRSEALKSAETNIAYLQSEFSRTSMFTLQQSIGRLLEAEFQKLMLARGNEEFAFKIIDPAQVPKIRSRPRRTLTVILATFVGGIISVLIVLVYNSIVTCPSIAASSRASR